MRQVLCTWLCCRFLTRPEMLPRVIVHAQQACQSLTVGRTGMVFFGVDREQERPRIEHLLVAVLDRVVMPALLKGLVDEVTQRDKLVGPGIEKELLLVSVDNLVG